MTAPELRTQVRRWFVETGWVDGNGIGLWDVTDESVEVASKAEADALCDKWLADGKIERDRWGYLKRTGSYGAFRIRSVWEDATSDLTEAAETRAWNAAIEAAAEAITGANGHDEAAERRCKDAILALRKGEPK